MAKKYKKEFHFFTLTDFEEEEIFLREKHKNGQKFVKVQLPGIYCFEECEPEDVVYRLDFNPKSEGDKSSYQQMFADYGWEYMQDLNEFSYFRKKAENEEEGDMEIFSDMTSRFDMVKRIFMKRMVPFLAIFFLIVVPNILKIFFMEAKDMRDWTVFGIWIVLFAVYLWLFIHCGRGFYRLKEKYAGRIN